MVKVTTFANKRGNVQKTAAVGDCIVDLISFEKKLIIKVDGGQCAELTRYESDRVRVEY